MSTHPEKGPTQKDLPTPSVATAVHDSIVGGAESKQDLKTGTFSPRIVRSQPDEPLPDAFGRYKVQGVLGRGGYGTVYVGLDTELNRRVAIKVSHEHVAAMVRDVAIREARRLAQLRHPGIVVIHDIGVENECIFIVTDFVEGQSLLQWMQTATPSMQKSIEIVIRIAEALDHAHKNKIIHRDIKPANVMLTKEGDPIVLDFGIARGGDETIMPGQAISGTPGYMSPEQAQGLVHLLDERTDVFSLGVLLYELLAGRVPFEGPTGIDLMRQVIQEDPAPLRQLRADIPAQLEEICNRALAKKLETRYPTTGELAADLRLMHKVLTGGAPMAATPIAAREAERRRVTLMLCGCELSNAEESFDLIDPEEQHGMLNRFRAHCEEVVIRLGGAMLPASGREFLVCFGYPVAHEDTPLRAVRAGLAIVQAMPDLNKVLEKQFRRRINASLAIHSGQAVVGDSPNPAEGISIIGDVRSVVSKLAAYFETGAVVVTEATLQLILGYVVSESRGKQTIRGLPKPIEMFRIVKETAAQHRVEVGERTSNLTPLVGRDTELSILRDRWELACEGSSQVVLLIGEAGLGKSRLVREIKMHVSTQATKVKLVEWRCSPYHQSSSLNPATDYFFQLFGFQQDDLPVGRLDKLVEHLKPLKLADPESIALFAGLLSIPLGDRYPIPNLTPQKQKEKTLEKLCEWLNASARQQAIVFIIEDLHWIDPTTLELLGMHLSEERSEPMLTLFTFRPEFEPPWKSNPRHTQISLNRLNRRQLGEMLEKKLGGLRVPKEIIETVAARTEGVPLFVEEFAKLLSESAAFRAAPGDSGVLVANLLQEIPATLQDLLIARLDRMASIREVVHVGSTIGREFSYDLQHAVCSLDEAALHKELDKLIRAELIFQKGRGPNTSYTFKHALIQDAAYQSMLKKKRQQYHQRIAEVLIEKFPETAATQPELVAQHLAEANQIEESVGYWLKAGLRAQNLCAHQEAIQHLSRGLQLLATLDHSRSRDELELALQVPLGVSFYSARGYAAPEVGPIFDRAHQLCRTVGDPAKLFYVVWGMWAWRVVRSDLELCRPLALEIMDLATSLPDLGFVCEAHFVPEVNGVFGGDFVVGKFHGERCLQLEKPEQGKFHCQYTGQNSSVATRNYLALACWFLGEVDRGINLSREALALGRELEHPFTLSFSAHQTAWVMILARRWDEVLQIAKEANAVASAAGFQFWLASSRVHEAIALFHLGQKEEGLALATLALAEYTGTGGGLMVPMYHAAIGEMYVHFGRFDEAEEQFQHSLRWVNDYQQRHHEAETYRLLGELAKARGDILSAENQFLKALEVSRRQQARSWELRALMSLARLRSEQGRGAEVLPELQVVYSAFTEGLTTLDLMDAQKMIVELQT